MCDPSSVLDTLCQGFRRFQDQWYHPELGPSFLPLIQGQEPRAMVIACSDSRVDPAIVLDAAPGELFMVRNVANLVPPYQPDNRHHGVSAALEYAVRVLEVTDIVVMGHARCGGFARMRERFRGPSAFIDAWMSTAAEAMRLADAGLDRDATPDQRLEAYAQWGVRISLDTLMTFPWIAERVGAGRLQIHGLYFDLLSGSLQRFNPETARFECLVPAAAPLA